MRVVSVSRRRNWIHLEWMYHRVAHFNCRRQFGEKYFKRFEMKHLVLHVLPSSHLLDQSNGGRSD